MNKNIDKRFEQGKELHLGYNKAVEIAYDLVDYVIIRKLDEGKFLLTGFYEDWKVVETLADTLKVDELMYDYVLEINTRYWE